MRSEGMSLRIRVEGAIVLPVTLSGGVQFASWKVVQCLLSVTVKVILVVFMRASAQLEHTAHEMMQ